MSIDPLVTAVVLLAALMHAGWNFAVKREGDQFLALTIMAATSGLIAALLLPFAPVPGRAAWPYLVASGLLHTGYRLFLAAGYRHGDLSHVYPIGRGAAPVLVVLLAWTFAGERLPDARIAGVVVIAAGIAGLAFHEGLPSGRAGRALVFALITASCIASYTVVDGIGARFAATSVGYALWLFAFEGAAMLLIAASRSPVALVAYARDQWRPCLLSGLIMSAGYFLIVWALVRGDMALVSSLRETSVLFAAFLGAYFLEERLGYWRILCTALVLCGLVLLHL